MRKNVLIERDVEVEMRDGTILRADVYRPQDRSKHPVLLQRTPYGKGFAQIPFALMAVERDYAVVIQDTRGRWASEGENVPLVHEMSDGYDTVQWTAEQTWSNGSVGMYGASYVGYTQLAAAVAKPPALKTIIPGFAFSNPYHMLFTGGALNLGAALSWSLLAQAQMEIEHHAGDLEKSHLWARLIRLVDGMSKSETFTYLPLKDMPLVGKGEIAPFFYQALSNPKFDAFWQRVVCRLENINIPVFHIGGWYDIFVDGTTKDFIGIRNQAEDEWIRKQQKMMIGPWTHVSFDSKNGEIDFGLVASWMTVLPDETQLNWFDYWLRDDENGIIDEPPIHIFVMGENAWRFENEWPLARTKFTPYYFHSHGGANTRHGDGRLSTQLPDEEPVDNYLYDPRNPVLTRGGGLCCWEAALPAGPYDQREIEDRPDVLVYSTPPLEREIEVTGPIQVVLWAASSAPDTDFTAKLVDVEPNGYARNIQEGIVRARYREADKESFLEPGEVYVFTIDLGPTSNLFKASHRIRVEISSSNFPHYDRNPNTDQVLYPEPEMSPPGTEVLRPALQTIFHDRNRPSHIILPVIPRPEK